MVFYCEGLTGLPVLLFCRQVRHPVLQGGNLLHQREKPTSDGKVTVSTHHAVIVQLYT